MSVEAIVWAFKTSVDDASAKLVLVALANFADEDGKSWPSQKRLAAMCSMGERTVRAAIGRLEARGLISREERHRPDGGRTSDMITLRPSANSAGGVCVAKSPTPRPTNTPAPPAKSAGLTLFEPSEEEPSDERARGAGAFVDLIWKETPTVAQKRSSKGQLRTALDAALKRNHDLDTIRQAVAAYYQDPDTLKDDGKWAKGVHRVVQNDFWETWAQAENVVQIDPEFTKRRFRTWMQDWIEKPYQWRHERGPAPDEAGCRIPPEIMAEFGREPVRAQA